MHVAEASASVHHRFSVMFLSIDPLETKSFSDDVPGGEPGTSNYDNSARRWSRAKTYGGSRAAQIADFLDVFVDFVTFRFPPFPFAFPSDFCFCFFEVFVVSA